MYIFFQYQNLNYSKPLYTDNSVNNFSDLFLPLDELVNEFKSENNKFLKKCNDVLSIDNEDCNKNLYIQEESNNEKAIHKYIHQNHEIIYDKLNNNYNLKYTNKLVQEILKNKTFIPINILFECIKNFTVKFNELFFEIEDAFPRYYKHIKGFLESLDIEFSNDVIRFMKKADIHSILIDKSFSRLRNHITNQILKNRFSLVSIKNYYGIRLFTFKSLFIFRIL